MRYTLLLLSITLLLSAKENGCRRTGKVTDDAGQTRNGDENKRLFAEKTARQGPVQSKATECAGQNICGRQRPVHCRQRQPDLDQRQCYVVECQEVWH